MVKKNQRIRRLSDSKLGGMPVRRGLRRTLTDLKAMRPC